jgi:thioredoxin-related protein
MKRLRRFVLATLLGLPFMTTLMAAETPLPFAHDLPALAAASAQQGMPLILLVSLSDCNFCEQIRRQHLAPLLKTGVPVWQIHLDTDGKLVNFDGKTITERQFAKDLKVRVAPSVYFFDAQGRQIAEPLVGTMLDDFYAAYLDNAILAGGGKLKAAPR